MKVMKIIHSQRESAKYALCKEDNNTMSLQKISRSATTGKNEIQMIKSKTVQDGIVIRKQYNPETGDIVGQSIVEAATKYRSGLMMVNDVSIKMEKPYHFYRGKIVAGDLLRPKGLQILATEELSPMAQRFIKLVLNASGGVLRL